MGMYPKIIIYGAIQLAILLYCFGKLNGNLSKTKSVLWPTILFVAGSFLCLAFSYYFVIPSKEFLMYPLLTTAASLFYILLSYFIVLFKYYNDRNAQELLRDFLILGIGLAFLISIWLMIASFDVKALTG